MRLRRLRSGCPWQFVPTSADGVPRLGVVSVGDVARTTDPVPVAVAVVIAVELENCAMSPEAGEPDVVTGAAARVSPPACRSHKAPRHPIAGRVARLRPGM